MHRDAHCRHRYDSKSIILTSSVACYNERNRLPLGFFTAQNSAQTAVPPFVGLRVLGTLTGSRKDGDNSMDYSALVITAASSRPKVALPTQIPLDHHIAPCEQSTASQPTPPCAMWLSRGTSGTSSWRAITGSSHAGARITDTNNQATGFKDRSVGAHQAYDIHSCVLVGQPAVAGSRHGYARRVAGRHAVPIEVGRMVKSRRARFPCGSPTLGQMGRWLQPYTLSAAFRDKTSNHRVQTQNERMISLYDVIPFHGNRSMWHPANLHKACEGSAWNAPGTSLAFRDRT